MGALNWCGQARSRAAREPRHGTNLATYGKPEVAAWNVHYR